MQRVHLSFLCGSLRNFGYYCVMMEEHWNSFVHDWVVLPKFKQLFVRGKAKNDMFGARELSFAVVALRVSFKLPERRNQEGFCTHDSGCCSICRNG